VLLGQGPPFFSFSLDFAVQGVANFLVLLQVIFWDSASVRAIKLESLILVASLNSLFV
jgi:hypothetical protein